MWGEERVEQAFDTQSWSLGKLNVSPSKRFVLQWTKINFETLAVLSSKSLSQLPCQLHTLSDIFAKKFLIAKPVCLVLPTHKSLLNHNTKESSGTFGLHHFPKL